MLAELRRLRDLQLEQARALDEGDLDALERLNGERLAAQEGLGPVDHAGLAPADLAEARALIELVRRDQDELTRRAVAVRDALRAELGSLGAGRTALAGYRPPPAGRSLYLDRSR